MYDVKGFSVQRLRSDWRTYPLRLWTSGTAARLLLLRRRVAGVFARVRRGEAVLDDALAEVVYG